MFYSKEKPVNVRYKYFMSLPTGVIIFNTKDPKSSIVVPNIKLDGNFEGISNIELLFKKSFFPSIEKEKKIADLVKED